MGVAEVCSGALETTGNTARDAACAEAKLLPLAFALLGIGIMCPWNAFINARPYFEARLCGESGSFTDNIEVWFSILYNVASVLSLAVLLWVQYYFGEHGNGRSLLHSVVCHPLSSSWRVSSRRVTHESSTLSSADYAARMVLIPLTLYLAVFLGTTILVFIPSAPPSFVLYATLLGLFLCGVCTAVASAGIIGTAGLFDADVGVGPYFQGQAAGGLIVALMNTAAAWSEDPLVYQQNVCQKSFEHELIPDDSITSPIASCVPYTSVNYSTGGYFALNCIILVGCILGYMYVDRKKNELDIKSYTPVLNVSSKWMKKMDSTVSATSSASARAEEMDEEDGERCFQMAGYLSNEMDRFENYQQDHSILAVWNVVKLPALALFLTYLVTLALFPVITSDLTSVKECQSDARIRNDLFVPLTFLIFNLGDLLGRFVVADDGVEKHRRQIPSKLVMASLARLAFIPIFFLCYSRKSLYSNFAIPSDFFSFVVQLAMAVTNGVLTTVSFSVVAILVPPDENMQQVASSILNLSLCLGLVAGGLVASPLLWLFTGHW